MFIRSTFFFVPKCMSNRWCCVVSSVYARWINCCYSISKCFDWTSSQTFTATCKISTKINWLFCSRKSCMQHAIWPKKIAQKLILVCEQRNFLSYQWKKQWRYEHVYIRHHQNATIALPPPPPCTTYKTHELLCTAWTFFAA